jgi:hypothetical protein
MALARPPLTRCFTATLWPRKSMDAFSWVARRSQALLPDKFSIGRTRGAGFRRRMIRRMRDVVRQSVVNGFRSSTIVIREGFGTQNHARRWKSDRRKAATDRHGRKPTAAEHGWKRSRVSDSASSISGGRDLQLPRSSACGVVYCGVENPAHKSRIPTGGSFPNAGKSWRFFSKAWKVTTLFFQALERVEVR